MEKGKIKKWDNFTIKEWEEYIKCLVKENDKAMYRAIVLIDDLQTEVEKASGETIERNGVGFTGPDANFMSRVARKIKRGGKLTAGEYYAARNKIGKYWRQLMLISKKKIIV
jgi:hypothetical protein